MSRRVSIVALSALLICLIACSNVAESQPEEDIQVTQAELAAADSTLRAATVEFGFKLFREVVADAEPMENVFISPLSVLYPLILSKNGAAGETDQAFADVLGVEGHSNRALNQKIQEITDQLSNADADVQFKAANSIWSRTGKGLVPEFVAVCQDYFDAIAREMNFQAPGAADIINNWVAENTNDKITEIVKSPISPDIALLLLNAIYFNANWTYPFDTVLISTRPFHLADGSTKDCELMFRDFDEDRSYFDGYMERPILYFRDGNYYTPGTVMGASVPYGSEGFYMTLLMPDTAITMEEFMNLLTAENWQSWQKLRREHNWCFAMPRFRLGYDITMNDILASMGLDIAFESDRADFSNMFVDGTGCIDKVKHKAFIQV
ncbi:MAG: hypothetical protein GF310_03515, partial [candidate division Zixibacteria bacterium]|nr:hypothetical protein [candidate division Zixibacteria bacterium]